MQCHRKLRIIREPGSKTSKGDSQRLRRCPVTVLQIESGEVVNKGCGQAGLVPWDTGWRCLYCGNYVYRSGLSLEKLWFHFKNAREYWRSATLTGRDYINGVAVIGQAEDLPLRMLLDLKEIRPPKWFTYYLILDDKNFKRYVESGII